MLHRTRFSIRTFIFFKEEKKLNTLSHAPERKQTKVAKYPVSYWASLVLDELLMLMIVWHLYEFASILLLVSMNPMNVPACKPKEHVAEFRHMLNLLTNSKISSKSVDFWILNSTIFSLRRMLNHYDIINIDFWILPYFLWEYNTLKPLIGDTYIFQSKREWYFISSCRDWAWIVSITMEVNCNF